MKYKIELTSDQIEYLQDVIEKETTTLKADTSVEDSRKFTTLVGSVKSQLEKGRAVDAVGS